MEESSERKAERKEGKHFAIRRPVGTECGRNSKNTQRGKERDHGPEERGTGREEYSVQKGFGDHLEAEWTERLPS